MMAWLEQHVLLRNAASRFRDASIHLDRAARDSISVEDRALNVALARQLVKVGVDALDRVSVPWEPSR
jgi:hypothetical protein